MPLIRQSPYQHLMPGQGPHLSSIDSIITDIFARHGLLALTDVDQPSMMGPGFMGMQFDTEAIEQLKAAKEGWDDQPAADKIVAVMMGMLCRPKKAPEPTTLRLVGTVPATHRAVILVAHSFFPVAVSDTTDLRKLGRWSISVRDEGGVPSNFSGDILDHEILAGALELITSVCVKWKKELGLDPLVNNSTQMLGEYVDVPANFDNLRSMGIDMEPIPPGEGVGYRRKQSTTPTPEQLAALRAGAIQSGAFDDFRRSYPDQPTMTADECEAGRGAAGFTPKALADDSDVPPEHRH
jgi:hypothetical protein